MTHIPIAAHGDAGAALALRGGAIVTAGAFAADVARLASRLPERRYLVNFCVDRYRFAVGLAAALVRDQVSLLPPSQAPGMLAQLDRDFGPLYALVDAIDPAFPVEQIAVAAEQAPAVDPGELPAIPADRLAAIAFTSGSTGLPTPHRKYWGALARGAQAEGRVFGLQDAIGATVVATVPAQHMYGLESSLLMPLQNALALHAGRPFYPADIAAALAETGGDRVLVTTPVHLRALLEAGVDLPGLRLILCATAPLSPALAARAEQRFAAPLHEVYGCTEAGMVATRHTASGPLWHCLPGVSIAGEGGSARVSGGHVGTEVPLADVVDVRDAHSFLLHGRSADMVNIAGRRTSLAYLTHELNAIEGVKDGVFFMPGDPGGGVERPVAFAVAPGLTAEAILSALRDRIDAVFLPRPLHLVGSLPRDATGKLQREALLRLVQARQDGAAMGGQKTVRRRVAADHPAAPGHFPGNPILPGVVLLDEVIAAARGCGLLSTPGCVVRAAKFLRPVRPGEELAITLHPATDGSLRFECRVGAETAASGSLQQTP